MWSLESAISMGTMKTLIAGILSVIQPSGKNQILHIQSKSTATGNSNSKKLLSERKTQASQPW